MVGYCLGQSGNGELLRLDVHGQTVGLSGVGCYITNTRDYYTAKNLAEVVSVKEKSEVLDR